jgi:putative membrane protein
LLFSDIFHISIEPVVRSRAQTGISAENIESGNRGGHMGSSWHAGAILAGLIGASVFAGCGDRRADDTAARMDSPDTMSARSETADTGAPGAGRLSDANIVALLDEANMADSASGAYALGKATSPDVKTFAKLMMGEHHSLRVQGQQLARKLNLTPEPPADDPLKPAAASEMAALRAAPKGAQFDRTYIEQEIGIHKAVLDLAEKAHGAAQNGELKKLIEQAKPVIEKHLDRAEEIQKKLGKPSA